jgi:L-lactate dehydrogenase
MSGSEAKVTVVGAGSIGSTIAYSLALENSRDRDLEGAASEVVVVNRDERKAWAKAFDLSHCLPELPGSSVRSGRIEDSAGSDAIVLTVGVLPREDGTRADVLADNVRIYAGLVPALAALSPKAVFIAVTNPVDAMAYAAFRLSGFPAARVLGSGTELDAMRLRSFVADARGLDSRALSIEIVGEHGDSMVPLWSRARYGGRLLAEAGIEISSAEKAELLGRTKRAGWDIRQAGEHSCYGIAFSCLRILRGVLDPSERPQERTISVSTAFRGEYGIEGAYMSLPTRLDRSGAGERLAAPLADAEAAALRASAAAVRAQMDEVDRLLDRLC